MSLRLFLLLTVIVYSSHIVKPFAPRVATQRNRYSESQGNTVRIYAEERENSPQNSKPNIYDNFTPHDPSPHHTPLNSTASSTYPKQQQQHDLPSTRSSFDPGLDPFTQIDRPKQQEQTRRLLRLTDKSTSPPRRMSKISRILTGLLIATSEESSNLDVQISTTKATSLRKKHIKSLRITFSRLSFKPLRLGGLTERESMGLDNLKGVERMGEGSLSTIESSFAQIDLDASGKLDRSELAQALLRTTSTSPTFKKINLENIVKLSSNLLRLYDINGDGELDRYEYGLMVEDIALIKKQGEIDREKKEKAKANGKKKKKKGGGFWPFNRKNETEMLGVEGGGEGGEGDLSTSNGTENSVGVNLETATSDGLVTPLPSSLPEPEYGSIELKNFTLDLRQLVIPSLPLVSRFRSSPNLIKTPITVEVEGSFNRYDILNSFLLDAGLRRLVARALRLRVRTVRDLADGAMFVGRTWNLNSPSAPLVEVPKLTNIEFDDQNRVIITGRAKVQASPDAVVVENGFKLRTKLGTSGNGRYIGLRETELAILLECPRAWEKNIMQAASKLKLPKPTKPQPIVFFIPLGTARKLEEEQPRGFDLGPDNEITEIWIDKGALRFKLSAVLRPGKFLGNNYIAFSVPIRTFIITRDRVRAAIRSARQNKRLAIQEERKARSAVALAEREREKREDEEEGVDDLSPGFLRRVFRR
ncbi:hypothetical protein TL16_g06599 [Triparma laevis f. inornata]|nr:hypothetical protein TL16_g06599 [Triparma laevis f. inornata]